MKYILILTIVILFIGCGEVQKKEKDLTTYDFWDYRVSDENITKVFDLKIFQNDYLITTNYANRMVSEIYQDEDTVSINNDYNITKYGSYIENNTTIETRFIQVGGIVRDDCTLNKHYDNYNPTIGVDFDDVLQLKCEINNITMYINYSKEYGNIGYAYQDGNFTVLEYYTKTSNYKIENAF